MNENKPWYLSKTIWVGILTTIAGIIPLGVELASKQNIDIVSISTVILGIIQVVRRVWLDPENPPAAIK